MEDKETKPKEEEKPKTAPPTPVLPSSAYPIFKGQVPKDKEPPKQE